MIAVVPVVVAGKPVVHHRRPSVLVATASLVRPARHRLGCRNPPFPFLMRSGRTRMNTAKFSIEFGEHISSGAMCRMVSIIAAYGNVVQGTSDREFGIEVFRTAKLAKLKRQLTHFERCGDIRWSEHSETSD
jgi:hypothetical protein